MPAEEEREGTRSVVRHRSTLTGASKPRPRSRPLPRIAALVLGALALFALSFVATRWAYRRRHTPVHAATELASGGRRTAPSGPSGRQKAGPPPAPATSRSAPPQLAQRAPAPAPPAPMPARAAAPPPQVNGLLPRKSDPPLLPLKVQPKVGYLSVDGAPYASLEIDGHPFAKPNLSRYPLPVGTHQLVFKDPILRDDRRVVTINPGQVLNVSAASPP